ncbi:MAG TPA: phosphatase PAP2 family protein [Xanthobacteraceae bacterium]|nr:phosphatase PAP2 family protein [Xanthobacteraceae bacterium]
MSQPSGDLRQDRSMVPRMGANLAAWIATLLRPPRKAMAARARPLWPPTRRQWVIAGALLFLFVVTIIGLDWWIDEMAQRRLPRWVLAFFATVTDFGKSGWFLLPLGIGILLIAASPLQMLSRVSQRVLAALVVRLGFIFLAIGVPGLFTSIAKRLVGRGRPYLSGATDAFLYAPFAWKEDYTSLPSGHATNVVAAAIAIGAVWPQARLVMWFYAAVIMISRVALAAHFPSDVLAGAIIGAVGAWAVRRWFALRRLGFTVDANGSINPLTPPSWRRIKQVAARLLLIP